MKAVMTEAWEVGAMVALSAEAKALMVEALRRNAHHETRINQSAGVLRKCGGITLEVTRTGYLVVTNGWYCNWICIYGGGKWAADFNVGNAQVRKLLDAIAS